MSEARTATEAEARKWFGKDRGVRLGYWFNETDGNTGSEIIYEGDRHLLLFGPTSTGKTTRFLMVNLLSDYLNDRSLIVVDPKGELAAVTAKYRHQLGHDVKILDPFGRLREIVEAKPQAYRYLIENDLVESAGFNPLAALDPGPSHSPNPSFYDDAAGIGEALIKIEGSEPHWSESAQGLVVGLLMWDRKKNGTDANLENIRELLTEPDRVEEYISSDGTPHERLVAGLRVTAAEMVEEGGYEIASLAARFTRLSEELASIRSAGDTQTRWILSERMRRDLKKKPGIDFGRLKVKPTTVYVILPAERMRTHSVWLRLVIVSALRALYRPGGLRTVMFIDEMAALGHLGPLEDAFGLVRGYGIQIVGILQDLNQVKALYSERWESFLANAGVVQAFAPNDMFTADWMSRRSGQTSLLAQSVNESVGASPSGASMQQGASWQYIGRPKYFPYDLFGFEAGTGLLWIAGLSHSVRFFAPFYFRSKVNARALPNPYAAN